MLLKDFLIKEGTEKNLCELILHLSKQAHQVKLGYLKALKQMPADEQTVNPFGEKQMALDKYADEVFISGLRNTRLARFIATEEQHKIIVVDNPKNDFGVVIDPLDGSSLIDVNLCTGPSSVYIPAMYFKKG